MRYEEDLCAVTLVNLHVDFLGMRNFYKMVMREGNEMPKVSNAVNISRWGVSECEKCDAVVNNDRRE